MRFFPVLLVLLAVFLSGSASAQEATANSSGSADSTGPNGNGPASNAPSVDEYNNIPPGIFLSGDISASDAAATESPDEDVVTMDDLISAYEKGQYDFVAKQIPSIIAKGGYSSQTEEMIGMMYRKGLGVPKDTQNALLWLTKAAEAGRPLAQHHLAIMAYIGEGGPADPVKALMWLQIAIVHYQDGPDKTRAMQDRDNVSAQLGRLDRLRALQLAHDWLEERNEGALLDQSIQP